MKNVMDTIVSAALGLILLIILSIVSGCGNFSTGVYLKGSTYIPTLKGVKVSDDAAVHSAMSLGGNIIVPTAQNGSTEVKTSSLPMVGN